MPDNGKMSQLMFIKRLKDRLPELRDFPDSAIMERVLAQDPTVRDRVEMISDIADAQYKKYDPQSPVNWEQHPTLRKFAEGATDMLPGLAGIAGGMLATPETMGLGTALAAGSSYGIGRGARDLIREYSGLEHTTPVDKALGIAGDTLLAAATPGAIDTVLNPREAGKTVAHTLANKIENIPLPPRLRGWVLPTKAALHKIGMAAETDPLVRPSWQTKSPFADEVIPPEVPPPTSTGSRVTPPSGPIEPTLFGPPSRVPGPTGTGAQVEPIDVNAAFRQASPLPTNPLRPTGIEMNTPGGVPEGTGPFGFKMNRPAGIAEPTPSAPSSVIDENVKIVGNEARVAFPEWTKENLTKYESRGYRPGGRDENGNFYMKKRMQ